MPRCEHHEICVLDANPGEDLCIPHSKSPTKDKSAFDEAFEAHREKHGPNFQHFVFPGRVDHFKGATFTEWARFFYATFTQGADFSHTKFTEGADFSHATFTGYVKFFDATFTKNTKFSHAEFTAGADFRCATFTEWAYFANAAFTQDADFTDAEFNKGASFSRARFTRAATFAGATFTAGTEFSGTAFLDGAQFILAKFLGRTLFISRREEGLTIPSFSGTEVDFRDVIIEPLDALTFRDADLRKCRLQGTDLRKAEITAARWPKKRGRLRVYDEDVELPKGETRKWSHIERVYRELKQNYEDRRDYERAGDFHYGEKEMRRKNRETPLGRRFLLWLYWLVSGYGERCLRPLGWAVGLLTICTAGYLRFGLAPAKEPTLTLSCQDWPRAAHYSFRVMTLLKPDDLVPVGECARWVGTFESLLGPVLIGLFALALRQRLKR